LARRSRLNADFAGRRFPGGRNQRTACRCPRLLLTLSTSEKQQISRSARTRDEVTVRDRAGVAGRQ
jgi:hypothetical protein